MYLVTRSGLSALAAAECPQPVSGKERDELRDGLYKFWHGWAAQAKGGIHWHEGHPDIKAFIADIAPRMRGLWGRPKLLRCNKEARKKAEKWTNAFDSMLKRVKSRPQHFGGYTQVKQAFKVKIYNGPTYTIRSTNDPEVSAAMSKELKRIVEGPPATILTPPTVPDPTTTTTPTTPTIPPDIGELWESVTTGQVFGIEKSYITYTMLGFLAYKIIFGRIWK